MPILIFEPHILDLHQIWNSCQIFTNPRKPLNPHNFLLTLATYPQAYTTQEPTNTI